MHQKTTFTLDEAIQKLEYYCAYQERCHQEVVKKLEGMHMIPEAIDVVVVHLIENNFLNSSSNIALVFKFYNIVWTFFKKCKLRLIEFMISYKIIPDNID